MNPAYAADALSSLLISANLGLNFETAGGVTRSNAIVATIRNLFLLVSKLYRMLNFESANLN